MQGAGAKNQCQQESHGAMIFQMLCWWEMGQQEAEFL